MIRYVVPWRASGPGDLMLLTARGRRLTKLVTPERIFEYDDAALFSVDARRVDGIEDVEVLLHELAGEASTCVIRAALKVPVPPYAEVRCRIHDREGQPALFREVPRSWVMVDIEPAVAPPWIDPTDPVLVGGYLRRQLPRSFQAARCVVQLSSGAGLKRGLRAHLWFYLDRPLVRAEVERLLGAVDGLDASTLRPRQLHYTAAPLFVDVDDPCIHGRLALLPGFAEVEVPELAPAPARQAFSASVAAQPYAAPARGLSFRSTRSERYMLACLQAIAAATPGSRHPTIVRVAARLYGLAKAGALDPRVVEARVRGAVNLSTFDRAPAEIDAALQWAWDHAEPWRLP